MTLSEPATIIAPVQNPILSISGLRGVVGDDLLPETVTRFAAAFGSTRVGQRVALGRDSRLSGEMLAAAAVAGLASVGCEVVDLGIVPTPTVLYYTRTHNLAGGIVITASHNPDRWNGMKFCRSDGTFLRLAEIEELRSRASGPVRRIDWLGLRPVQADGGAVDEHVAAIVASGICPQAGARRRIGIDAANGAAAVAAKRLVERLGHEVTCIYCDPSPATMKHGFPRRPEPMAAHLGTLCTVVREQGLDAGLAFDPDGDRFSCVDETGTPLGEEATICLACLSLLGAQGESQKPKAKSQSAKVVVNLSTTRAVEDVCRTLGAEVVRTPVGEVSVLERMLETGAVLGGEGNGGVIVPTINPTRDGLVAAATVLALLSQPSVRLSAIRQRLPHYEMVKTTLAASREEFAERTPQLLAGFGDAAVDTQDGLRLEGSDYWLHVRPSNTEPLLRIIAEAGTRERAEAVVEQARRLLGGTKE